MNTGTSKLYGSKSNPRKFHFNEIILGKGNNSYRYTEVDRLADWLNRRYSSQLDDYRKFFFIASKILDKAEILRIVNASFNPWVNSPRAYFVKVVQGTKEYRNYVNNKNIERAGVKNDIKT